MSIVTCLIGCLGASAAVDHKSLIFRLIFGISKGEYTANKEVLSLEDDHTSLNFR